MCHELGGRFRLQSAPLHFLGRVHGGVTSCGIQVGQLVQLDAPDPELDVGERIEEFAFAQYQSKELVGFDGDNPVPSAATDLWSLGCVLWELAAGKTPCAGATVINTCANISKQKVVNQLKDAKLRDILEKFFLPNASAQQLLRLFPDQTLVQTLS